MDSLSIDQTTLMLTLGVALGFVVIAIILLRKGYREAKNRAEFWTSLGGHLLTIASIFVAAGGLLLTLTERQSESVEKKMLEGRTKALREFVRWEVSADHIPKTKNLNLVLVCNKTEETIEPKQVDVIVKIEYRDDKHMPAAKPLKRVFTDIKLERVGKNQLTWKLTDIKSMWSEFMSQDSSLVDPIVLTRPLAIEVIINYNLDIHAEGKALMFPEYVSRDYMENGIQETVKLDHIISTKGE